MCILNSCDNATEEPSKNGANYNFTWDGNLIPLDSYIVYHCQDNMAIENATKWKSLSSTNVSVYCDPSDGQLKVAIEEYQYRILEQIDKMWIYFWRG